MTETIKTVADRAGHSLVAATKSLTDAVLHTCAAITSMVEGEVATNQLGATRRESKRMLTALDAIMDARQSQIHARTSAFRRAQMLDEDFGASCGCLGDGSDDTGSVTGKARLAAVA